MIPSDEQMNAIDPAPVMNWRLIDLPEGRQLLPAWARDMHIDFMDAWSNSPHFTFLTYGAARDWPNKRFDKRGSMYIAESDDGRAEVYYHDGGLSMQPIKRWFTPDGKEHDHVRWIDGRVEPGEWREVERLCTTQQQGFGGTKFEITLLDGTQVILRGPWHGGSPDGYTEAAYRDYTDPRFADDIVRNKKSARRHGRTGQCPWWTCTGGLYVRNDVFVTLFARFAPHLRLVEIINKRGIRLEPLKPDWIAPKKEMLERGLIKYAA